MLETINTFFNPLHRSSSYRCLIHRLTAAMLTVTAFVSCNVEDERDLCCDPTEGLWMHYRYIYLDEDVFPHYITDMDHYLFDSEGNFLERLAPGADLQKQELHLSPATYTMVTIGNRDERQSMERYAEEGLDGFIMRALSQEERSRAGEQGEEFHVGELYGGFCRFTVKGEKLETFLTDMSNIHCQLDMRVVWERTAPVGDFKIELSNVPSHYNLDYEGRYTYNGYDFPTDLGMRDTYAVNVPQKYQRLETTFVTLRYTSECIPVVTIFDDNGSPITPELPLEKAFQSWGWNPDYMTVQHYRIIIEIRADGSVLVRPWLEGNVLDWVLGAVF